MLKIAVQLDRIFQPPQHTDSRRMHLTTQLITLKRTPEAPLRVGGARGPTRSCGIALQVVFWSWLFEGSRSITEWHPHGKYISQPRPDPLTSCKATPYPYMLATKAVSAGAASRTTPPTVRLRTVHHMFLFAPFTDRRGMGE